MNTDPATRHNTTPTQIAAHTVLRHRDGVTCIWDGTSWFVPLDVGGEGYACSHPEHDEITAAERILSARGNNTDNGLRAVLELRNRWQKTLDEVLDDDPSARIRHKDVGVFSVCLEGLDRALDAAPAPTDNQPLGRESRWQAVAKRLLGDQCYAASSSGGAISPETFADQIAHRRGNNTAHETVERVREICELMGDPDDPKFLHPQTAGLLHELRAALSTAPASDAGVSS